jgi:hypothetical protein
MTSPDPKAIFDDQLNTLTAQYDRDRSRHKRRALALKISTSALGAGSTVLLGWQNPGSYAVAMKNGALVFSALITLLAAYDAFFEPRKLWVRETFVLNSLKDLKREWDIATALRPTAVAEDVTTYSGRFNGILSKSLDEWIKAHNSAQ